MNLHRNGAGKGWVSHRNAAPRFQWLCLVALQWLRRVKHAHLLEMIQLREQGTKWQQRWKKGNVSNPGSLRAVFLHVPAHSVRAFVHLSALLPALPSWPPHCAGCFQPNSSCQDCIPDPSAPAVRGYVLNLHSAFFFVHLE